MPRCWSGVPESAPEQDLRRAVTPFTPDRPALFFRRPDMDRELERKHAIADATGIILAIALGVGMLALLAVVLW